MVNDKHIKHMKLALYIATLYSKDPSTKVGTLVLGRDEEPLVHSWNGFIRGDDDSPSLYADREYKYGHIVHSEMNAIANAGRVGTRLKGAVWYVTAPPCDKCIGPLLQTGPSAIYFLEPEADFKSRWQHTFEHTAQKCSKVGVPLYEIERGLVIGN